MDFEIDYGAFKPATRRDTDPLYASVGGRVNSLSNDEIVFYDTAANHAHVMTQQVLQALDLSRGFRTLNEHAARVIEALPQLKGQQAAVRRVLDGLVTRGLMVEGGAFLAPFKAGPVPELAPFAGLFVRASDRPAQLRQLLATLHEREQLHGGGHAVTVVDDSAEADNTREHRALVASFGDAAGVPVQHLSGDDWSSLAGELLRELPEHAPALRRLLERDRAFGGRRGGGTGKNLITLLAAGSRYALLDDDFLFPLHRHPEYRPGLTFDQGSWAPRTFADPAAALAAGSSGGDWLGAQLALCGAPLSAVVGRVEGCDMGREELRRLVPSRMPHLDPDARVMATVNGHRGDAGASGMAWLYVLDAAGRAGWTADRATYLKGLERPAVWHGARRFHVARGSHFTPFMVDNSRMMPCTSPFGRSEDALFSALSGAWWSDGVTLGTPFAIGHLQEGARGRPELLARPETPDVNLCIAELVRGIGDELLSVDPVRRNAVLVTRLRDLAEAPEQARVAYLREYLAYLRSSIVQALQKSLAQAKDAPVYWAADLRQLVEVNGRTLADDAPPRLGGWPENLDAAGCAAAFRGELHALADGLEAWPAAWEVACAHASRWRAAAR